MKLFDIPKPSLLAGASVVRQHLPIIVLISGLTLVFIGIHTAVTGLAALALVHIAGAAAVFGIRRHRRGAANVPTGASSPERWLPTESTGIQTINQLEPSVSLELNDLLPNTKLRETHQRTIKAPIDDVWDAVNTLTAREIRLFGPLMKIRHLPQRLHHPTPTETAASPQPVLKQFVSAGFVVLRADRDPKDGRAVLILGAATKFWLPDHSNSINFSKPSEFVDFSTPGFGRAVLSFEATEGEGITEVVTTTLLAGTDAAAQRRASTYWALIKIPGSLIRRNWLAAIDQRATAQH